MKTSGAPPRLFPNFQDTTKRLEILLKSLAWVLQKNLFTEELYEQADRH